MSPDEFHRSLTADQPPAGLTPALSALWWAGKSDWERAHEIAQSDEGADASWVHAYLHRQEGDLANASYWYRRAGRPVGRESLHSEWAGIVSALLG
jgi:hypothetical protein